MCSAHLKNEYGNIAKEANFTKYGARKLKLGSLDGEENVEYNGIDFVTMPKIFTTQNNIFLHGAAFFDGV